MEQETKQWLDLAKQDLQIHSLRMAFQFVIRMNYFWKRDIVRMQ